MSAFHPPDGYSRIKIVRSFDELVTSRLGGGINALCWERKLRGDFREIVRKLGCSKGITTLDDQRLQALDLSAEGSTAREVLLEDQRLLRAQGLAPVLDCIGGYPRDEEAGAVSIDVYSFHADSAPVETDTWLCSYQEAATEALRNDEAVKRVDVPEIRAQLLREFEGKDDEAFREYLNENCHDLHYAPVPGACRFSFGFGHLWRIAVDYPGSPVPPCIHRAPETRPGDPPRLLLIS